MLFEQKIVLSLLSCVLSGENKKNKERNKKKKQISFLISCVVMIVDFSVLSNFLLVGLIEWDVTSHKLLCIFVDWSNAIKSLHVARVFLTFPPPTPLPRVYVLFCSVWGGG